MYDRHVRCYGFTYVSLNTGLTTFMSVERFSNAQFLKQPDFLKNQ